MREVAEKAMSNPCYCYECIHDGFKFRFVYQPKEGYIEAAMSYVPGWPHTNYMYGKSVDELMEHIKLHIQEDKKIWKDGGRYSN